MKKRPVIYKSFGEYFVKRVAGPVIIWVAAFAFAFVFFYTTRASEMVKIRAVKAADAIESSTMDVIREVD